MLKIFKMLAFQWLVHGNPLVVLWKSSYKQTLHKVFKVTPIMESFLWWNSTSIEPYFRKGKQLLLLFLEFCENFQCDTRRFHSIHCSFYLLRKKCPYSELFWSAFFPHFPTVRMRENAGKMRSRITPNTDTSENK